MCSIMSIKLHPVLQDCNVWFLYKRVTYQHLLQSKQVHVRVDSSVSWDITGGEWQRDGKLHCVPCDRVTW